MLIYKYLEGNKKAKNGIVAYKNINEILMKLQPTSAPKWEDITSKLIPGSDHSWFRVIVDPLDSIGVYFSYQYQ